MGKLMLLDCTLRDGGYINDWNFGKDAILDIEKKLETTGVDIIEVGFLKKEEYNPDRTVFSAQEQIGYFITPKKKNILYAGMVEVVNPLPIEDLTPKTDKSIDIIRVIVWKRLLKEGFEYCKAITDKGYKVCVQPARNSQYSEQEFIDMIHLFNQINPMAIYVVDSWGTQLKEDILKYVTIADKHLKKGVALGFHGHNNLQQASSCSEAIVELELNRDVIIDGSIHGIGRGAGNLNIELFSQYLNKRNKKEINIKPMFEIYSDYIAEIYLKTPWGYSLPYNLTAYNDCNPQYAHYYHVEKNIPVKVIAEVLSRLNDQDKVIFKKEIADTYLNKYLDLENITRVI